VPSVLTMLTALILLAAPAAAQEVAAQGRISGRVVDAASGRPISAAIVSIGGGGTADPAAKQPRQILTGADGRFVFDALAPGSYLIRSTKGGYAEGASGRRRPGGSTEGVAIDASTPAVDIAIRMWKTGAIGGTLTDEAGEALIGATVRLVRRNKFGFDPPPGNAFVRIPRAYTSIGAPVQTDDRGAYRFGNLPAGDYLVLASPPPISATRTILNDVAETGRGRGELLPLTGAGPMTSTRVIGMTTPLAIGDAYIAVGGATLLPPPAGGHARIYPATFYPSATSAPQASVIALATGEERTNVDVQLTPVPVARVSGIVMGPNGPEMMASLHLVPLGSEDFPPETVAPTSVTDAAGAFVFAAVTPGQYILRGSLAETHGTVSQPIAVAGDDIDGLVVTARPALRVTATAQFDGDSAPPAAADRRGPLGMPPFLLEPTDTSTPLDQLAVEIVPRDSAYLVAGYPPGRYRVRVLNSPVGWMFKAALLNGVDVSETPFDLTRDVPDLTLVFTDRWTSLGGVVQGTGSDGAAVLAFPADASQWTADGMAPRRFKMARANARGEFGISALPPGDYYVAAVPEEQTDGWRAPAILDALARVATLVTIADGEHKTVAITMHEIQR
jgi:hypothetical protein